MSCSHLYILEFTLVGTRGICSRVEQSNVFFVVSTFVNDSIIIVIAMTLYHYKEKSRRLTHQGSL